jgi:hypothetical protein
MARGHSRRLKELESSSSWKCFLRKVEGSRPDEVKFLIYLILPATLGPGVHSASNRNEYRKKKMFLGSKVRPVRGADNITAIYEPIV